MPSKSWKIWLPRDFAAVAVICVVAELSIRSTYPYYGHHVFDQDYTADFPMRINDEDYRGAKVLLPKPADDYRVLALGDSITFGTGVPSEATWPERLGAELERRSGKKVSVINAGIEGASLKDLSLAFDQKWSKYDPDLVALALTGNMVSLEVIAKVTTGHMPDERDAKFNGPESASRQFSTRLYRATHYFCLPSFLSLNSQNVLYWVGLLDHSVDPAAPYGAVLAHGYSQGNMDPTLAGEAWTRLEGDLAVLRDKIRTRGKTLLVSYVEPRFLLTGDRRDNEKNVPLERLTIDVAAKVAEISARLGLGIVDATEALRAGRARLDATEHRFAPMYIPFDYAHLDPDGHQALAATLATQVDL